jgi:type II secretory pathway component PulF
MGTTFDYRVIDRQGKRQRGQEQAQSPDALTRQLSSRGLLVLEVEPAATTAPASQLRLGMGARRSALDLARALAALLGAGLPVPRALGAAEAMVPASLGPVLSDVRSRVERGESLAASLAAHAGLFSGVAIGLVRAGERSGNLPGAFTRLTVQLEREHALRSRLLSVSIYPLVLAVAGGSAVLVLLFFVLPRFAELLQDTGMTLPRSTAALLAAAAAFRAAWPLLLALPIIAGVLLLWARGNATGKLAQSRLMLGTPGLGTARRQLLAAQFARVLAVLTGGGAPLMAALDSAADSLSDPSARMEGARIRARVREGAALHRALAEGSLFPPALSQLVALGEETGRLPEFLTKAADLFEERTERAVQRLVTLAEPAMIIVFGGLVGFVALSLLQAVYSINVGSFR